MENDAIVRTLFSSPKALLIGGVALAALVALGVGAYTLSQRDSAESYYKVVREPLQQTTEFSGIVTPQSRAELAFELSGRVVALNYDIGDAVAQSAVMATLESGSIRADILREEALLASEEAALAQLLRGTREEELSLERARVVQYEEVLIENRDALTAAITDSYTVSDTAMVRFVDALFNDPETQPKLKYNTANRSLEIRIENERLQLERLFEEWEAGFTSLSFVTTPATQAPSNEVFPLASLVAPLREALVASTLSSVESATTPSLSLEDAADLSRDRLIRMREFLEDIARYTRDLEANINLTDATIEEFQTQAALERTNIATAISALNAASEKYTTAQQTLSVGRQQLALLEAGATAEDILIQEAKIDAQRAQIASLQNELAKHVLRAPKNGVVSERMIEVGEITTAQEPIFTLDTTGYYEIEARISELDVVFLETGQIAEVTLDPYGASEIFSATISKIDPAESVVNGSTGYRITLTLSEQDPRLKAGMTANAVVTVILKESALTVPVGFISHEGPRSYLYVSENGSEKRQEVRTGLRSTDGLVEIISGVSEGEHIVPYDK